MAQIIAVNAVHPGSGVSTIAANVAALLAIDRHNARVGVIDACLSAPTMHLLFGLPQQAFRHTLNDVLLRRCRLGDAVHPIAVEIGAAQAGTVLLVPANPDPSAVALAARWGYAVENLGADCVRLATELALDCLLIDTEAGLPASTLAVLSAANSVLLVLALDKQNYQATARSVAVVDQFAVEQRQMVVNLVSPSLQVTHVQLEVARSFGWDVTALLPYCAELSALASASLFVLHYPAHAVSAILRRIAASLAG